MEYMCMNVTLIRQGFLLITGLVDSMGLASQLVQGSHPHHLSTGSTGRLSHPLSFYVGTENRTLFLTLCGKHLSTEPSLQSWYKPSLETSTAGLPHCHHSNDYYPLP